jgi:hypothetical protein
MIAEKWFVREVYWYYLSNYLREKRILKRGLSDLLVGTIYLYDITSFIYMFFGLSLIMA